MARKYVHASSSWQADFCRSWDRPSSDRLEWFLPAGLKTSGPGGRSEGRLAVLRKLFQYPGMETIRCPWLPADRPLYVEYHDTEWGVPSRDARHLFEMICLEGAQAGLSWWTVLQKRERYRQVFHGFDPVKVAGMTDSALEMLVLDPGIIRHRGKILSVRENAKAWLRIEDPVTWLWSFAGGATRVNRFKTMADYPAKTPESDAMSKALRKAGFNFVGSTTMYAFMQAVGMVDDHSVDCFRK